MLLFRECIYYYYIVCRLLGFRRAFPVTGRSINLTSEIFNICTNELRSTFFTSLQPYNNLCLTGTCRRYCDIYHPVCGQNGLIEVSAFRGFSYNSQRYTHRKKNMTLEGIGVWPRPFAPVLVIFRNGILIGCIHKHMYVFVLDLCVCRHRL